MNTSVKKICFNNSPFVVNRNRFYTEIPNLSGSWITLPGLDKSQPAVLSFRLDFTLIKNDEFTLHVSGDNQYLLWIDGECAGRGCEMKSPENWYFESYEITAGKGSHVLHALVWNYGSLSPENRVSIFPGFILVPDHNHTQQFATGIAPWKVKRTDGINFQPILKKKLGVYITAPPCEVRTCGDFYRDEPVHTWNEPLTLGPGIDGTLRKDTVVHCLVPTLIQGMHAASVPPGKAVYLSSGTEKDGYIGETADMSGELNNINYLLNVQSLTFEPLTVRRIIFRLDTYVCGFACLSVKGGRGTRIRITWAEAAFTHPDKPEKSNRDEITGKYLRGLSDEFVLDGEARELSPLSWRPGRFIELVINTGNESLFLEKFIITETRYPLEQDGNFRCNRHEVNEIIPLCFRTLQVSAHDNFIDCPYYEQLPYTGDGRLECLANLVICNDDTLVKKMILLFEGSRDLNGFTMASWPRMIRQVIPSFSLSWIAIIYDYALWRSDRGLISQMLPSVRNLLDNFMANMNREGLLRGFDTAWNFIDWVDEWAQGECAHTPPGMQNGVNVTFNWLFIYILGLAAELESYAGDPYIAQRWEKTAEDMAAKLIFHYWDTKRKLFTEDDSEKSFSEHAQILAVLSNRLHEKYLIQIKESLFAGTDLAKCSIFFKHYLFEACRVLSLPENIFSGLKLWNSFIKQGLKTAPETPVNKTFNQRSDCHGWGAHPLYHLISNIAGIRPAEMGFKKVHIEPMPGDLSEIDAECVHPQGKISVSFRKTKEKINCTVSLPENLPGDFRYLDFQRNLKAGAQTFEIGV